MSRRWRLARWAALAAGAGLLAWGLIDGGFEDVLHKAMFICYECMGIG